MHVIISDVHASESCTWCSRDAEGVTVEFDGDFLKKGPLCWKCLQQAVRVHHRQSTEANGQKKEAPK